MSFATMDCPDENRLVEYVERRLPPGDAQQLAAHTESCASCRKLVVALTRLTTGEPAPVLSATAPLSPADVELKQGTPLGRYLVQRRVGQGAMGVVYQAHDPALDRKVALKLLRPGSGGPGEAQARLRREGQAVARLSHPNVITVHDVGEHEGQFFVAMELIDGQTLRQWLATRRSSSVKLSILIAAGRGLAAAHQAQLVHRDFKPDNVLVARNRVVVTDFGLATEPAQSDAQVLENASLESQLVTRTGALLGTPAYMAPEQLDVRGADARSDQFSFCVTCYEALTGSRPFGGADLKSLRASISQGVSAAGWARVPSQVKKVLERGLKESPEARYPSMEALLHELEPRRPRGFVPAAVAAVALLIIGGGGVMQLARACSGARSHLAGTWDGARRQALAKAFEDSKLPFQKASFDALAGTLDGWADEWTHGWESACVATRERGEQSEELLDLRMACLEQRQAEVRSLIDVLAQGDEATIRQAPNAMARVPAISSCADLASLRAPVAAAAPALHDELSRLRAEHAQVAALFAAAHYADALPRAQALVTKAIAMGYRPFEAEARLLLGGVLQDLDQHARAEEELNEAIVAAEAGGHLALAAEAWARLVHTYEGKLGKYPEAHRSASHAAALLDRLGGNAPIRAVLFRYQGDLAAEENHYPDALKWFDQALVLQRQESSDSASVAGTLSAMGDVHRRMGDLKEAVELHQQALGLLKAKLGDAHPSVGIATKVLGNDHWSKGELAPALEWYRKAEAIQLAALGPDALELASVRVNIAAVLTRQQKLAEAETTLKAVLATREKKLGADNPGLFPELNNLAVVYRYQKRLPEARQVLMRALVIAEKAHGPLHDDVATTRINLGDVLLSEKSFDAALAEYEKAADITEKLLGPDHPSLAECFSGEAFPLLEMKRWPRALQVSARALAIFAKKPGDPLVEGMAHIAHARARWELEPANRSQAKKEAALGRAKMAEAGAQADDLAEVDAWLKRH